MKVVPFVFFFLLVASVDSNPRVTYNPEAYPCGNAYWCPPGYIFAFGYQDYDCNSQSYPLSECLKDGGLCVSNKTHPDAGNLCNANCCRPSKFINKNCTLQTPPVDTLLIPQILTNLFQIGGRFKNKRYRLTSREWKAVNVADRSHPTAHSRQPQSNNQPTCLYFTHKAVNTSVCPAQRLASEANPLHLGSQTVKIE
ncbi:hypothetical protein DdX_10180 [Ditylenchus destructor]|uniref:Secreted protein n=1 Tax=Ditylenchus destructor TaxID=166010 RepID=A0AAD4R5Q2_9BILA|nr:hypothetical protein DdX_10180 [Ditylenchus destructor]